MNKQIKLIKLELKNFKGVRHFVLEANGQSVKVFGDNATGKTTIFDAFIWLLFDKDSQNKKDFQIKTLNENNEVLHGFDHEVEGTFDVNGKRLVLRKVYAEKWTKVRGSAEKTFTGHTTKYFIDDVPKRKKEYVEQVSELVSEDVFKLLTSPSYFNEQLHWKEKRNIVMEVSGGITDDEVIQNYKNLEELPSILNGRKIEDYRRIIASKRAAINEELNLIPVRIDEVQRSIPDVSNLNKEELDSEIEKKRDEIQLKEDELSRIRNGSEVSVKENRKRELEGELIEIKSTFQLEVHEKINEKREEVFNVRRKIDDLSFEIEKLNRSKEDMENSAAAKSAMADALRAEWYQVSGSKFEFHGDTECSTCGQPLPKEKVNELKEKAFNNFNLEKSQRLEEITKQGKALKAEVDNLKNEIEKTQQKIDAMQKAIDEKTQIMNNLNSEINELQKNIKDVTADPSYVAKQQEIDAVEAEIKDLRESMTDSILKVNNEIKELKDMVLDLEQEKAKFEQVASAEKRIAELEERERELSSEFEQTEHELYLTEEFIRAKVNMLEEKINSRFKFAKFRLFDEQINGGLQETCETLYKGVPYSSGLNNAARINVGLDIINTLSEHYGVSVPIFVDNAEAVTSLIEINSQVISLTVSENDKKLRIEHSPLKEAI